MASILNATTLCRRTDESVHRLLACIKRRGEVAWYGVLLIYRFLLGRGIYLQLAYLQLLNLRQGGKTNPEKPTREAVLNWLFFTIS